jgi:outer membrane protein assembly factor BamB
LLLRFNCKDCGQKYQVPDDYAAGEFKCVECGGEMEIPENSTLHDRPAVDLGADDDRPLVNIPVNVKKSTPNNVLGSEKDFIEKSVKTPAKKAAKNNQATGTITPPKAKLSLTPVKDPEIKQLSQEETLLDEEPEQAGNAKPSLLNPNSPPAKLSSAPVERSAMLSKDGSSAQQIKPPAPRAKASDNNQKKVAAFVPKNIAPGDGFCEKHPHLRATSVCNTCRKPICLECRQEWGYYCSEKCRDASLSSIDRKLKSERNNEYAKMNWVVRSIKLVLLLAACVMLGYLGMWVWRQFLDPGGKIAWKWEQPVSSVSFKYLSVKPDHLKIFSDQSIITLDTQTGKVISLFTSKDLKTYPKLEKAMKDKLTVSGESGVATIDLQGKLLWKTNYKDPVSSVSAGSEIALVRTVRWVKSKKIRRTRDGNFRMPPTAVRHLYALDLVNGKNLWDTKLDKENYLNIAAIGDKTYISITSTFTDGKSVSVMKVNDLRTRKALWQIKLPNRLTMGPLIFQDKIIFKLNDSLNAISMAGKKIWKTEVQGSCSTRNFEDNNGLAFFNSENTLSVLDLNKGKILWSKPMDTGNISYVAGKLLMGTREEDKEYGKHEIKLKLPPAYEKLKKDDPMMEAMLSGKKGKRVKYNRFIICLDAQTGKQLWKSKKVIGQLVVGYDRAVIFRDSATTSMFSVINSSHGKTVVEQLDMKTGEWLFNRNDDIGISGPLVVAGDKLIGLIYDRKGGRPQINFKNPGRSMNLSGIAAFNLK